MQPLRLLRLIPKLSAKVPPSDPVHLGLTSSLRVHRTRNYSIQALPNYIGRNILLLYLYYLGIPSLFTFDMVFLPCGSDIWSIQGCQINFLGCCRAKTKVVLYKVQLGLKENRL